MYPKEFLKIGGGLFVLLALLGAFHVLGPSSADSVLKEIFWIDWTEVILFATVGLIFLSALPLSCEMQSRFIFWVDWLLLPLFVWSLFSERLFTLHLEYPFEPLMLLVLFIWGHLAAMCQNPKTKK